MKKIILLLGFAFFILQSCGDSKPKEKQTPPPPPKQEKMEVVDSVAIQLENTKEDIEKASKEVDKLLEEI
ncbi:hypothetical protein GCQ56_19700 [Marinifilum sp. N1E240]|uniref:hypothetical protein n=1 Tax=Marinifilum sp. N1E240 TaxID=2608082 RepID=UPI00128D9C26|nr:hypothetical protein [Marinifilum sp. N1E240]MPQ49231.1 hypothetical protein [Marinifilum sp. N1E240]